MRKWHRWLSLFFGVFLLWIAATGVASHVVPIVQSGFADDDDHDEVQKAAPAGPPGFVCPETMTCRPKPKGGSIVGTLHHLHSGESFGPAGVVISLLSGLSLLFFAFSGLWMYIRMWSHRRDKDHKPAWFWK